MFTKSISIWKTTLTYLSRKHITFVRRQYNEYYNVIKSDLWRFQTFILRVHNIMYVVLVFIFLLRLFKKKNIILTEKDVYRFIIYINLHNI